jgi:hypothetical protein
LTVPIPQAPIVGVGVTFGGLLTNDGLNLYGGPAVALLPGPSVSVTRSGSTPSPGLNLQIGGSFPAGVGGTGQVGYGAVGRNGSSFGERGLNFGTNGISGSATWVSQRISGRITQAACK